MKKGILEKIVGGWRASSIITFHSGFPFTPTINSDNLLGNSFITQNRPDRICTGTLSNPTPNQWFNTSCFVAPVEPTTPGTALRPGTSGYDILRGPGFFVGDMGLSKTFRITERAGLEFRSEFFNILNHSDLGLPVSNFTPSAISGSRITTTDSVPRIIQFAMKLHF